MRGKRAKQLRGLAYGEGMYTGPTNRKYKGGKRYRMLLDGPTGSEKYCMLMTTLASADDSPRRKYQQLKKHFKLNTSLRDLPFRITGKKGKLCMK